jgi:hypothetical protein
MPDNLDGIRRVEGIINDVKAIAEQALAVAMQNALAGQSVVLPIELGGTGSSTKIFVDILTNQFEIDGYKVFRASTGFQNASDIVDSGELAGNVRLISCDAPAADVGPQLRFSGRFSNVDKSAFAFGTIAGRKENGEEDNKAGYLQFATTTAAGIILEHARIDSEGTFGIGTTIPIKGLGNRLHVSLGDILLDAAEGNRSFKIQIDSALGRLQSLVGLDGGISEHLFLSTNVKFLASTGTTGQQVCELDNPTTIGSAVIELRSDVEQTEGGGGFVRFLTGGPGECPLLRGQFSEAGLDVIGDALVTQNVIAGGAANAVGGIGNCTVDVNGFVTGDNIKYGSGSPEGRVCGPIGAIYGRSSGDPISSDPPDENSTLWLKVFNDGEPTGWLPIPVGTAAAFCAQSECPPIEIDSDGNNTIPDCRIWFDTTRKMLFFYDPDVIRDVAMGLRGCWLSAESFQLTMPITDRSHTQQFRRSIDKDYEYLTPIHITRQQLNMYLVDMTAAIRVARNSSADDYEVNNYYTFDLVTIEKRQGDPSANRATRQEWPGDREAYENKRDNLRADGHTTYPNLRDELIRLSSLTPDGPPLDGVGTVTRVGRTRRLLIDETQLWDGANGGQWKERSNNDTRNGFPENSGFRVTMITGALVGQTRTISTNTSDTLTLRRPWRKVGTVTRPQVGDQFEIVDSSHKKIIARISTKGNVFPDGAHVNPDGNRTADPPPLFPDYQFDENDVLLTRAQVVSAGRYKSRDVQDFVTSITNGVDANDNGGFDDLNTKHIKLDHYINIIGADGADPDDAVVLAGLWDAVRRPGRIAGVIALTYKLALPPTACSITAV